MSRVDAHIRRIEQLCYGATGPAPALVVLDRLSEIDRETRTATAELIDSMRDAGHTWSAIGAALGVTKQSAQQRYGPKPDDDDAADLAPLF